MSFSWHGPVLQLSSDESEIGGWVVLINEGEAFEGESETWMGLDFPHSRVGELTYIDPSGLCQGDGCLISI